MTEEIKPVAWISEAEADALRSGSNVRCLLCAGQTVGTSVPLYFLPVDVDDIRQTLEAVLRYEGNRMGAVSAGLLKSIIRKMK